MPQSRRGQVQHRIATAGTAEKAGSIGQPGEPVEDSRAAGQLGGLASAGGNDEELLIRVWPA